MRGRLGRYLPLLVIWLPLLINAGHVVGFTAWTTWLSFTPSDLLPEYDWAGLRSYRAVLRTAQRTGVEYAFIEDETRDPFSSVPLSIQWLESVRY